MKHSIDRRTALRLGGAATVAAVAGCSDILGDGDSSSGATGYSQYLGVTDNQIFFAYADFKALEELEGEEGGGGGGGGGSGGDFGFDDPMLAPAGGLILIGFSAGFQLAPLGLGGLIQTQEESDLDSQGNQILIVNEATVIVGDMDTDELDEQITATSEENAFETEYEQTEESDGYTFYEPVADSGSDGGSQSGGPVAVSDSALLLADNRGSIDTVIDAINGDGRAAEEFDEFQWLLDNGGDGVIAIGGYGPDGFSGFGEGSDSGDSALNIVEDGGGFVGSITLDGENANSVIAASSDAITEEEQSAIESEFQSDRTDVSFDFPGDGRLIAEATYSQDVLQGNSDTTS